MPTRKIQFNNGDYYHIYNRGVEKRDIIIDEYDELRFLRSLNIFNTTELVGSVFEYDVHLKNNKNKQKFGTRGSKLVEIVAFNLLDNHFHLVLKQLVDNGISKFLRSLSGGFAKYFNEKYDRVGPLFQGPFQATFISIENLEKKVTYVNLNHVVHKFGSPSSKWGIRSSWEQYIGKAKGVVNVDFINSFVFNEKNSIEIIKNIIQDREDEEREDLDPRVPNKK